jgi:hypothetical protein
VALMANRTSGSGTTRSRPARAVSNSKRNQLIDGAVLPEEVAAVQSSILGLEQAPSSRQQLGSFANWKQVQDQLGQPFNNERIPLTRLKLMRRDAMIAFALHFTKTPMVRAPWFIKSPDPQVAAFIDGALRPVMASLIIQSLQKLEYGFQAIAKRFTLAVPDSTYIDPETGNEINAWEVDPGNVQPVTLKPFVALPPEGVTPLFDEKSGEFAGISYKPPQGGGAPAGTNAKSSGKGGSEGEVEIDVYHCSPPDEPVLTSNRGYVAIGDLTDEDRLVVWDKKQKKIYRQKGFAFETSRRQFSGELIEVSTERASTRVTPNHKFTVRWTEEAQKNWAVYLMRKGNWWRIGITPIIKSTERKASGIGQRVSAEGADAAWIVGTAGSKNEALFMEKLLQGQYGIPGLCFKATSRGRSEHCLTTEQMEEIWGSTSSEPGALRLLQDVKLDVNYPFCEPAGVGKTVARGMRGWTCHAVNLVPGLMEIPVDPGEGNVADWLPISEIADEQYEGEVISIDVPPHHHYVSNGVVTQNSLWVTNEKDSVFGNIFGYPRLGYAFPYWWSYWFRWAIADRAFERKGDPAALIRYPEGEIDLGNGNVVANNEYALMIGDRLRAGATIALPSTPYLGLDDKPSTVPEWDIDFIKDALEFDPFDKSFDYIDVMKVRSLFVPEQALIEGSGGTSSRNVAKEMYQGLIEAQSVLMGEIVETVNRFIIPHLMAVNFPDMLDQGIGAKMQTRGFQAADMEMLQTVIQLIGQGDPDKLGVDIRTALSEHGIPLVPAAQYDKMLADKAAEAAAAGPGEIRPTSSSSGTVPTSGQKPSTSANGNANVSPSATGFAYVAPHGLAIEMDNSAAEYLAGLPATMHYNDTAVRASSRALWNALRDFYRSEYQAFVAFLEEYEDDQLHLSDEEQQAFELAASDFMKDFARRLVSQWQTDFPGLQSLIDRTTTSLRKIVKRAAQLTRKEAGLSTELTDNDVETWTDNHVADTVAKTISTTRNELQEFAANFMAEGNLDPRELSKAIQAHFEDFPEWKADRYARTETRDAYNAGVLLQGQVEGLSVAQAIDARFGPTDGDCEDRDGQFFTISQALNQEEHPNGTLGWRLIEDPVNIERVSEVPGEDEGVLASFDEESKVVYLSNDIGIDEEREFLRAVGDQVAA